MRLAAATGNCVADDASGKQHPVFWGFITAPGVPPIISDLLLASKMALILDLDETLLVANTVNSIEQRRDVARKAKCAMI
jgi:hypothetical protein